MNNDVAPRLAAVLERIRRAELRFGRELGSTALLAVSKTRSVAEIRAAYAMGQRRFGESYLQEARAKITALADCRAEWHFIGPIQSNKTRGIAAHFDWVHSVDRLKIAMRLSEQRPRERPPLHLCLQVNVSGESSKSGVAPAALRELAARVASLPRLRLRGLMTLPAPQEDFAEQRRPFRLLRSLYEELNAAGFALDTLSMGMSADYEAAIAEGATIVRVGTAIFGARPARLR